MKPSLWLQTDLKEVKAVEIQGNKIVLYKSSQGYYVFENSKGQQQSFNEYKKADDLFEKSLQNLVMSV